MFAMGVTALPSIYEIIAVHYVDLSRHGHDRLVLVDVPWHTHTHKEG